MTSDLKRGQRLPGVDLPQAGHAAIMAYLHASGDDNPLHHEPATARQAGFADVLVPGMMVQGQMAEILASWLPGARIAGVEARFVQPVTAGSRLYMEGRVVALRPDGTAIVRLTAKLGAQVAVLGEAVIEPAPGRTDQAPDEAAGTHSDPPEAGRPSHPSSGKDGQQPGAKAEESMFCRVSVGAGTGMQTGELS